MNSTDYTGVSNAGCGGYTTLREYNMNGAMAPVNARTVVGTYVVPAWGAIGVDALTKGVAPNGGYFNINNAYGAGASNCQQAYVTLPCAPCGNNGGNQ